MALNLNCLLLRAIYVLGNDDCSIINNTMCMPTREMILILLMTLKEKDIV
jgi:hypothetical protein